MTTQQTISDVYAGFVPLNADELTKYMPKFAEFSHASSRHWDMRTRIDPAILADAIREYEEKA